MRKAVALYHLHTYTVRETISPQRNQLLPDDLGLGGLNDGFIMYGMRLRLSVCVFVKCYKVAFRSGYQNGRRSTSSNWIYRTGPRLGRIEKRFSVIIECPKGRTILLSQDSLYHFSCSSLSLPYFHMSLSEFLLVLAADLSNAVLGTSRLYREEDRPI